MRAEIRASWERSRSLGIDVEGVALPIESDLDPDSRLIRAAAPVLERLCARFSGLPVTVTLADARANIIDRRGNPVGLDLMDEASLVRGANVDERFMGTSSVSMVLSTRAPFVVVGHEHFLHNLKTLTCMAAPVRDPVGGTVRGVVNLSVPERLARPGMALVLQDATDLIGERLLELSTARERELVTSFLQDRERGRHTGLLHVGTGELAGYGGTAPLLDRQERSVLLDAAVDLIGSNEESSAEVALAGGRVATLSRRPLRHGDAEGAAVEVVFHGSRGAPPARITAPGTAVRGPAARPGGPATGPARGTATAPDGREVPLLTAGGTGTAPDKGGGHGAGTAPKEEAANRAGTAPTEDGGNRAGTAPGKGAGNGTGTAPEEGGGNGTDAWLLLVGESGVGRLAAEARGRLSLLNEAGVRVGTTLDMRRTAEELAEIAVPRFADLAVVELVEGVLAGEEPPPGPLGPDTALRRAALRTGVPTDGTGAFADPGPVRYPAGAPQARCLHTGRPVADSVPAAAAAAPAVGGAHPVALLGGGVHAYVAAPLYARGRVFGLAGFYRRGEDRPYEEDDLTLAGELAARAAISVDNARRFSREHDASLMLQRSLLPHALPRLTAADLASRYLPADGRTGVSTEVGGDWFDAIPLSGMRVALVVGDVAGHGLQAAATMGRLRTAVRTLAGLDLPPEEVLAHLDELVGRPSGDPAEEHDPATATTCLYAVYDPVTCRCTAARAGHPPPAVAPPGGEARLLDLPSGPPLGLGGLQPYESAAVDLAPGSLLALYTDGLLKEGLGYGDTEAATGRLLSALAAPGPARGPQRDPERVCDRITDAVLPGGPRDDVALLVARVRALPADQVAAWELPAAPSVVADARALVRRKLTEWGLADMEFTTGLVVSELVTNAVRYGGGGPVSLRLLRDETLICEVSDHSNSSPRIRRAATTEEGGRGLFLVAQFTRRWGARFMPQGKTVWAEQVPHADRQTPEADEHALLAMFDDVV
ncbi:SpoIIE family protein phosphatase [Streptomyces sp. TRM76323]|uniref:SpoIIE family protein phosphatase n=1 Tax=Streptomyces tamarix TaxID=3078565 RepID=A0ABU3QUW5_9ACTN|nr:SpoIIE family protein phosphatase [Streptomyces tamarix]MDT9686137.1 SpoIIE family protein phosphatase [Streptomyces tamarix]